MFARHTAGLTTIGHAERRVTFIGIITYYVAPVNSKSANRNEFNKRVVIKGPFFVCISIIQWKGYNYA